jgi:hypothetical protein
MVTRPGIPWLRLLAILALAGCAPGERPVSDLVPGIEPFDQLGAVALGTTAAELARSRPGAQPAAYLGYSEQVGAYRVSYELRGAETYERGRVPGRWKLESVRAGRAFETDSAAVRAYAGLVAVATRALSLRPTCHVGPAGRVALWRLGDGSDFAVAALGSRETVAYRGAARVPTRSEVAPSVMLEVAAKSLFRDQIPGGRRSESGGKPWRAGPCPT